MVVEGLCKLICPWQNSLQCLHLQNCYVANTSFEHSTSSFFAKFPCLHELRLISLYNGRYASPVFAVLDLSGCCTIRVVDCYGSRVESLVLSGCVALESLFCQRNSIRALDMTACGKLRVLDCQHNMLESLDLSCCGNIKLLQCCRNWIGSIILPLDAHMDKLHCFGNCSGNSFKPSITSGILTVSDLGCNPETFLTIPMETRADIMDLHLGDFLISMPLAGFEKLKYIICSLLADDTGSLDLTGCTAVEVDCECTYKSWLQIQGREAVYKLVLSKPVISSFDLVGFTTLTELHLKLRGQTSLDLSVCPSLRNVWIKKYDWVRPSDLTDIDLSKCFLLEQVHCDGFSNLKDINLASCTLLEYLSCTSSALQLLDVSSSWTSPCVSILWH